MTTIHFITGLMTFYLKGEISKDDNFIYLKMPNTILGVIPLGRIEKQLMVNQIASTSVGFRLILRNLIIGLVEFILGLLLWQSPLIGFLVILLGIATMIGAFQTTLVLNLTSGERIDICFLVFEKKKAYDAVNMINEAIYKRIDDTNTRKVAEWQTEKFRDIGNSRTDRIVDAINNSRNRD